MKKKHGATGIDVLCNNAGISSFPDTATVDGFDIQMQTNHLSHFLLTKELFPLLEKRAEDVGDARIVNHSSVARVGPLLEAKYLEKNGGNLGGFTEGAGLNPSAPQAKRYQQSKLANGVFSYALVDKLSFQNSKIKSVLAHPGVSRTNLLTGKPNMSGLWQIFIDYVFSMFMQSAEDGACGIMKCSLLDGVKSGDFYGSANGMRGDAVLIPPEDILTDSNSKNMLWEKSEDAITEKFVI